MDKIRIVDVLKRRTMGMFNDDWYDKTANELFATAQQDKGYVYFIRYYNSEHVKIGKARDLLSRIASFKTATHQKVIVIGFIYTENYDELERKLHNQFKDCRQNGEWFLINYPTLVDAISTNNGTFCNAFYDKKLSIADGIVFNANFLGSASLSIYKDLFDGFDSIIRIGQRYTKDELMSDFQLSRQLSKKKLGSLIKEYAKLRGHIYIEGNTNGMRWFKLEK